MTSADITKAIEAIKKGRDGIIASLAEGHTPSYGIFARIAEDIKALEVLRDRAQTAESAPAGVKK